MEFSVLIWRMFHIINLTSPETIQRTRSLCHLCFFFFNENNPCWSLSMGSLQSELFTLKRSTLNAREWRSFSQRVKFCYQQAFQIDYNRSFFPVTTLRLRGVGLVVQCSIPLTGYEAGLQCAGETTQVWDDVFWHIFKTKKKGELIYSCIKVHPSTISASCNIRLSEAIVRVKTYDNLLIASYDRSKSS